jgi:hypothetical protein
LILEAATASPPQIARTSCTSSSIASAAVGDLFVQPVTVCRDFQIEANRGAATCRALKPSALSECGKINSRWGIPSTRATAGAKPQSDLLVAIRKSHRKRTGSRRIELDPWPGIDVLQSASAAFDTSSSKKFRSGYLPSLNHTYIAKRLFCGFLGDPRLGRVRPWSAAELASAQLMPS